MINQQLLDFIKHQLQAGLTKEKISTDLLANGWNSQDIKEGFEAVSISNPIPTPILSSIINNPSNQQSIQQQTFQPQVQKQPITKTNSHSGKKIFWIVLILFLLATGASAYYFKDSLVNLPIVKNLFSNEDTTVLPEVPIQNNNTETTIPDEQTNNTTPATQEINATDSSLSTYNDPNGLYSFSYPKGAKIEYGGKYPGIWMTIPQWENSPIITIFSDINNTLFNSSIKTSTPTPQKSSLGNIDIYPVYKYSPSKSSLNDYSATYVIDLGNYNNTNLSIVFSVISNEQGPNLANQIEKIVKSFIINKNNIVSAIKVMSAKLVENQNYSNDISVRENLKKILAPAEIYYEKSNSYYGFCKSNDYLEVTKNITKSIILNCKDNATAYAVIAPVSNGYWCVDSVGYNNNASFKNTTTSCVK